MNHSRSTTQEREVIYILDPPPPPRNGWGTASFVFGLIGLLTFGLLSPIAVLLGMIGIWKRPRSYALTGLFLGLLGMSFITALIAVPAIAHQRHREARRHAAQSAETMQQLEQVLAEVEEEARLADTPRLDGFAGNAITIRHQDAWDLELRYDELLDGFGVRSAGPDRQFDTHDDLVAIRRVKLTPEDSSETLETTADH